MNVTGNLSGQKFEQAPEIAEFFAEGEIEPGSAKARIRYLGDTAVGPELYFKRDMPSEPAVCLVGVSIYALSAAFDTVKN